MHHLWQSIQTEMVHWWWKVELNLAGQDIISSPYLHWSYVDASTGRITMRGTKAKEGFVASKEKAHGNEALIGGKVAKVRKCLPMCIVCCAINDPKNNNSKITQTTIHFSICLVSLCTKRIGNRKTTCFECFHQIQDLLELQSNRDSSSANTSASKNERLQILKINNF